MIRIFALFFCVLLPALLVSPHANAITTILLPQNISGPYSTYFPPGQTGFVPSYGNSTAVTSGVSVRAGGVATAVRNGIKIPIPVSVTSTVSKSAVAAAAATAWKVARSGTAIGVAVTAWSIYDAYKTSGLKTCPPPDFFCFPETQSQEIITKYYVGDNPFINFSSGDQVCQSLNYPEPLHYVEPWCRPVEGNQFNIRRVSSKNFCLDGSLPDTTKPVAQQCNVLIPERPATDPEIQQAGDTDISSDSTGSKAKKYWDAADSANKKAGPLGLGSVPASQMVPSDSPTVVDAPPVSSSQATTSVQSFNDSQGVPQTKTTQETTTVTPTSTGSGTSTSITYNTTNNTTTTTTNNTSTSTSNPPTVVINTDNEPAPPPVLPFEIPKDYNKEVTQQQIAAELSGANAPSAPADQAIRTDTELSKTDADLSTLIASVPTQFIADKASWFSWVWTPPVGVCSEFDFSGSVHGYTVSWNICPWVARIREALGWLFAMFGAMLIYGQIFKNTES